MHHLWQIYGKFSDKMLCKREHKMKHIYMYKNVTIATKEATQSICRQPLISRST